MMAEDISTLVMQVKSDGIKEGSEQLTKLSEGAERAEQAVKKLGTAVAQASVQTGGMSNAMAAAMSAVNATNTLAAATNNLNNAKRQASAANKATAESTAAMTLLDREAAAAGVSRQSIMQRDIAIYRQVAQESKELARASEAQKKALEEQARAQDLATRAQQNGITVEQQAVKDRREMLIQRRRDYEMSVNGEQQMVLAQLQAERQHRRYQNAIEATTRANELAQRAQQNGITVERQAALERRQATLEYRHANASLDEQILMQVRAEKVNRSLTRALNEERTAQDLRTRAIQNGTTIELQAAVDRTLARRNEQRAVQMQIDAEGTLARARDQAERINTRLQNAEQSRIAQLDLQARALQHSRTVEQQAAIEAHQASIQRQRDLQMLTMTTQQYAKMQDEANKMNKQFSGGLDASTNFAHGNSAALRETLVLTHELIQGQYKRFAGSMLVMAEYTNALPKMMSAVGVTSAAGAAGVLALTAAVVGGVYAFVNINTEISKFQDRLQLAGNTLGMTRDLIEVESKRLAASSGYRVTYAREMLEAVAQQGLVTRSNMDIAVNALLAYQRLSGETAEDTVKNFTRMKDGVFKFAVEQAKTGIALSKESMAMIHQFEKIGDRVNATRVFFEEFGTVLQREADESNTRLNTLGKTVKWVKETFDGLGHWFTTTMSIEETYTEKIDEKSQELKRAKTALENTEALLKRGEKKGGLYSLLMPSKETVEEQKAEVKRLEKEHLDLIVQFRKHGEEKLAEAERMEKKRRQARAKEVYEQAREYTRTPEERAEEFGKVLEASMLELEFSRKEIDEQLERSRKRWIKDKTPRGVDDRQQMRDIELEQIRQKEAAIQREYEFRISSSKKAADKMHAGMVEELNKRLDIYEKQKQALKASYAAQKAITDEFERDPKGHTNVEKRRNELKAERELGEFKQKMQDLDIKAQEDRESVAAKQLQSYEQEMKHLENKASATDNALDRELEALERKEAKMDGLKSLELKHQKEVNDAKLESANRDAIFLAMDKNLLALTKDKTSFEYKLAEAKSQAADKEVAKRIKIQKALEKQYELQLIIEEQARETKWIDNALAAANRFEKGMTEAFGNVGKAIGGVSVSIMQMLKDQNTARVKFRGASEEDLQSGKAQKELTEELITANITGYAGMAEAAKGFFDKKSAGYRAADAVSKVLHAAELARNAVTLASNIATGASAMFAQGGFAGFAGVTAMVAVMAGLGAAVSGGGGSRGMSAAEKQKRQGTGSVFGDVGQKQEDGSILFSEKSESIVKALDLMKNNSVILIPLTQGMLSSLRNIERSMAGLTNLVARNPGIVTGESFGVREGTLSSTRLSGGMMTALTLGGGIIGSVVGALVSLWGKTTQNITDSGLQLAGAVRELQAGRGFQQYADVETTKSSWFGLVKKTSTSTLAQGLSNEISMQFGLVFKDLENVLKSAAPALGKTGKQVEDAINSITVPLQQVSLKGLSGQALQDAIYGVISKVSDDIAGSVFPGFERFAKVGEGYSQTLIRVANDVIQVGEVFKLFGKELSFTSANTVDIAERLVEMSGGLEKFSSNAKTFATDFMSSAEQLAPVQKALNSRLNELGVSSNLTMEEYKNLVLAQNLTTTAGQDMYLALAELAPAFKQVTEEVKKLTDIRRELLADLAEAQGDPSVKRELERQKAIEEMAKLGPEFVKLKQNIFAVQDAMQRYNVAKDLELQVLEASGEVLKATTLRRQGEIDALAKVNPELVNMKQYLYGLEDAAASLAERKQIESEIANLQGRQLDYTNKYRSEEVAALRKTHPELVNMKIALLVLQDATTDFEMSMAKVDTAFKRLQDSVNAEKALEDKRYEERKTVLEGAHRSEKEAAEASHKARLQQIEDVYKAQEDAATNAIEAAKKANALAIEEMQGKVKALEGIMANIKETDKATTPYDLADAHRRALKTVREAYLMSDITQATGLEDALKELTKPTENLFSTFVDYQRSQAEANAAVKMLGAAGEGQLTEAQKQLEALTLLKDAIEENGKKQIEAIRNSSNLAKEMEDARYAMEMEAMEVRHQAEQDAIATQHASNIAKLDEIINSAQRQIDVLNKVDNSILGLEVAFRGFATAVGVATRSSNFLDVASQAASNAVVQAQSSSANTSNALDNNTAFVSNLYKNLLGRTGREEEVSWWVNDLKAGKTSMDDVVKGFVRSDEYKSIRGVQSFAVGTNMVPEDMLANVHKGERIIPAADNQQLMETLRRAESSGDSQELRAKLDELIMIIKSGDLATVQQIRDMLRILRDWDSDGLPPERV